MTEKDVAAVAALIPMAIELPEMKNEFVSLARFVKNHIPDTDLQNILNTAIAFAVTTDKVEPHIIEMIHDHLIDNYKMTPLY